MWVYFILLLLLEHPIPFSKRGWFRVPYAIPTTVEEEPFWKSICNRGELHCYMDPWTSAQLHTQHFPNQHVFKVTAKLFFFSFLFSRPPQLKRERRKALMRDI